MQKKLNYYVKKIKEGKSKYFDKIYDLTKNAVFFTILKILKDRSDSEQVLMDTYISVINNINIIDDDKNVFSYLITTAKNKAINEYNKRKREVNIEFIDELGEEEEDKSTPLLDYCKSHLNDDEWQIIELCVVMGFKRVEVAKMLNKPVSTINWQYNNVLKKIKVFYKEVYDE